jgi:Icc-related predicted phosphoesterase
MNRPPAKLKIVAIADTHGMHRALRVPAGDILIHAGDAVLHGTDREWADFNEWLGALDCPIRIYVPGNHDRLFADEPARGRALLSNATVLIDGETTAGGLRIYGTPWSPTFNNWSFMADRGEPLRRKFGGIPAGIDVLVSHGPPKGILDRMKPDPFTLGSAELGEAVARVHPALHVFGHIHESYGNLTQDGILFVNASACTATYQPVNRPITVAMEHNRDISRAVLAGTKD